MKDALDTPEPETPPRIGAFVSVPRNACNTVRVMLDLGRNRNHEITDSPIIYEEHQRLSVLAHRHDLRRLFTFAFVRNPFDRAVSWYEYFYQQMPRPRPPSFEAWVKDGMPHHWGIKNHTDWVAERRSPLLQTSFLDGPMMFVGHLERFDHDMKLVIKELNARAIIFRLQRRFSWSPLHLNRSRRSDVMKYYKRPELVQLVAQLLAPDFRAFGYAPDLGL